MGGTEPTGTEHALTVCTPICQILSRSGSLLAAPEPRVVTLSSGAHRIPGGINFDDLQGERRYINWRAYGQSKLANLMFCFELQRRSGAAHAELKSMAAHPQRASPSRLIPFRNMKISF